MALKIGVNGFGLCFGGLLKPEIVRQHQPLLLAQSFYSHYLPINAKPVCTAGIFQIIVATMLNYLMEFLTFCQHFNNFFHTLFSCLLFFCGQKAKSNGEKIGLIETHKKRFCFFVFAKFF